MNHFGDKEVFCPISNIKGQVGFATTLVPKQALRTYNLFLLYPALSRSVVPDSLRPHGLQPARLFCPRGFSRQEYWSGLPCPPPEDLPNPEIELRSPTLQADSLPSKPSGKHFSILCVFNPQIFESSLNAGFCNGK